MRFPVRKIAFVLPNFQAGGAERVMITIANHLDRTRFQPVLIVFDEKGPLRSLAAADIPIYGLKAPRVRSGLGAFIKSIRQTQVDLVISTMAHMNMAVLLSKPFLGGIPVLVREAVTPSFFSDSVFKKFVLTAGYHLLYPSADAILSPTQMVFDEMPFSLRRRANRLHRIFNPVDENVIRRLMVSDDARDSVVATAQRLYVGAGRLVAQKGFDRLIDSLRGWRARDDWRLVILGEGNDRAHLQQMIDNYGLPQITLAGYEPEPWRIMAQADAFVLPSRHEGLPNVALEALALGVPVVAAESAGGIGEIAAVSQSGAVRIAQDMSGFVALMDEVSPCVRGSMRGSLLPDCFSRPVIVASYEQLFTDILSGGH